MRELNSDYKGYGLRLLNVSLIIGLVFFICYFMITRLFFLVIVVGFSALLQPSIQWVKRRFKVSDLTASLICLLIGLSFIFIFFGMVIVYLIDLFDSIIVQFPVYFATIIDTLKDMLNSFMTDNLPIIDDFFSQFNFNVTSYLTGAIDGLYHFVLSTSEKLVNQMIPVISEAIIQTIEFTSTTLIVLILIVLLSKDWQKYQKAIARFIPSQVKIKTADIFHLFIRISWSYLKVELIVSGVTTIILIIGFYLLKIENAFFLAIALGLVDLIPIIGVGLLLWPWILYTLVIEAYSLTIGLSALYIVIVGIRQFLEPKLISKQIGMNAFFVICLGYICFLSFGIIGVILTPFVLISIQTITESQLFQIIFNYIRYGAKHVKNGDIL